MRVEVSDEVIVVDEIERVCKESLSEYGGQRANFPCGVSGVKTQQVLLEDKGSSRVYVRDMWSPNGPLVFCVNEPGKARKCFNVSSMCHSLRKSRNVTFWNILV